MKPLANLPLIRIGLLGYVETAEHWALTSHPTEGNLGRTDLYLSVGLVMPVGGDWAVSVSAKLPVLSHSVGSQIFPAPLGELSGSRLLHLHEGEEEHGGED